MDYILPPVFLHSFGWHGFYFSGSIYVLLTLIDERITVSFQIIQVLSFAHVVKAGINFCNNSKWLATNSFNHVPSATL